MKFHLVKTLNGSFRPAFDSDYENVKNIPVGEPFEVEYKKRRNLRFHKKYFSLLDLVYQNQERYNNKEHLRHDLTIAAGFYDIRYNFDGNEVYEPKSISFASMDEIEFSDFYSKCIDVIVKCFNFDRDDIIEQVEQYF